MKRDLFLISVGMMAIGFAMWLASGNPPRTTRFHADQTLKDDIKIKFISEQSPYMRSER